MKKLILSALLTLNLANAYSATETVATIKEKGGARKIVITQEVGENNQDIVFTLKERAITKELNRLSYSEHADGKELRGKYDTYNFKMVKAGFKVTNKLYEICWVDGVAVFSTLPVLSGALLLTGPQTLAVGLGIVGGGVALCTVAPAIPAAVLSFALFPVDALITGTDSLVSAKAIANRKLEKAMDGKNKKASKKAFNLILNRINNL